MLLRKGIDDFPKAVTSFLSCNGCGTTTSISECVCVWYMPNVNNNQKDWLQFLACYTCVLTKLPHKGDLQ